MGAVAITGRWNIAEMQTPVTRIALLKRRGGTKSGAGGRKAKNEPVIELLNVSPTSNRRSLSVCSSPPKSYSLAPNSPAILELTLDFQALQAGRFASLVCDAVTSETKFLVSSPERRANAVSQAKRTNNISKKRSRLL
jgi:hypothetical protein